jgi:hypothetical protein
LHNPRFRSAYAGTGDLDDYQCAGPGYDQVELALDLIRMGMATTVSSPDAKNEGCGSILPSIRHLPVQ